MAAPHTLTVALDGTGFSWALDCPHDNAGADAMPDATRPPCRGTGECAARARLREAGPGEAWAGQRTVIGAIPVEPLTTDGGLLLDRATGVDPTPEECARRLARASAYPRYNDTEDGWQQLLMQEHLVEHAYRQAIGAGTEKAAADALVRVLRSWHNDSTGMAVRP